MQLSAIETRQVSIVNTHTVYITMTDQSKLKENNHHEQCYIFEMFLFCVLTALESLKLQLYIHDTDIFNGMQTTRVICFLLFGTSLLDNTDLIYNYHSLWTRCHFACCHLYVSSVECHEYEP